MSTGAAVTFYSNFSVFPHRSRDEVMQVTEKNLMVFPSMCARKLCHNSCVSPDCQLCKPCLTPETLGVLKTAYMEHVNRQDCKRVFPPHMVRSLLTCTLSKSVLKVW